MFFKKCRRIVEQVDKIYKAIGIFSRDTEIMKKESNRNFRTENRIHPMNELNCRMQGRQRKESINLKRKQYTSANLNKREKQSGAKINRALGIRGTMTKVLTFVRRKEGKVEKNIQRNMAKTYPKL